MAPPKPPNPSSKEILEEAIQISTLNLNNAMAENQEQLDVRFANFSASIAHQIGEIHSRMNAEREDEDSKYEALMAAIQKAGLQKEKLATVSTAAAQSSSPSGTAQNSSTILFGTPPFTQTLTPAQSPLRPPNSHVSPAHTHAVVVTSAPQIMTSASHIMTSATPPPPFHTYPPYINPQTVFIPPHSLPQPFPQPEFYPPQHPIPNLPPIRSPKLELSLFDGTNPLEWLFQADQYFGFYNLPPENRLSLVSFYMKGDALSWFKWMHQNHLLSTWGSFTRDLELRFGPSTFENHQAELFKLKQVGSVMEYQTKFEQLGNKVVGLPAEAILNCFISGLQQDIQNELAIHKPTSISHAIGLAKLIESKLKESKTKFPKPFQPSYQKQHPFASTSQTTKTSFPTPTTPLNPPKPPLTNQTKIPIRKLTQAQLQERRAQGLCFNCDENFFTGHKCTTSRFFILIADEEIQPETQEVAELSEVHMETDLVDTYFQLSPQAATGQFCPQTLKFKGSIAGLPVMVLVDTGSTHNIMQPRIAQHLNLHTTPINQFSVMVGNGSHLQCEGICDNVEIMLQNKPFNLPFYLLPIEGADIVLGMAWLRTLGPIQADFSIPSLTFQYLTKPITLTGDPNTYPTHTSFHQLKQLIHTDAVASFHLLLMEPTNAKLHFPEQEPHELKPLSPQITQLLTKFQNIFQQPKGLPPQRTHDHHINLLPNTSPINVKPYRYPHSKKDAMTTLIQQMLEEGTIVPSTSPFSSPVLLVKKKDGTWRFCVDYRALNAVTIKDRFPIPNIDELLDELGSATVFTKIDLCSGYHQIRVASKDTYKTAFRTFDGHYEFLVMPFGLTNGPSTFQSAMNDLLRPFLRRFVLVFFDDILIYSSNFSEHIDHLQVVFQLLKDHQYFVKLSKCVFAAEQINFLGHIISASGVAPDSEKIKAILDWPAPRSLSALRGFLGLTGFYRRFVKHYATLAAPLTDLLRSTKFIWSTEADAAFTNLKRKMTDMPVLALPNFTKDFNIDTDASGVAIGAVLSQEGHPIAFFSKKMCPRMQAASVYVREMFAITESVKKWRQYLIGHKFHIYTDQKSLRDLLLQRIQTPEQQRWTAKLQGFDFEISYKPGRTNLVADALSRKFEKEGSLLLALSSPFPDLFTTLKRFYKFDIVGQDLLKLAFQPNTDYSISQELLYYKNRVYIPDLEDLRLRILKEHHSTPEGGHSGVKATLARIGTSFCWPGMYLAVKNMVKHCSHCQHNKYDTQKKRGLLQPLPVPERVWEDITMDFIANLPSSAGHTVIWVLCDRLSKFVHFVPLPTHFTAKDLAARFTVEIFRLHGIPRSIVSDRDPLFLSKFWKHFFKLQGTHLKYSTSYHPETDGQTEVVNRSLETYLRCLAGDHPHKWHRFLHLAEYWYNTSFHTAIQMSPFKALYGRDPPKLLDYVTGATPDANVNQTLQQQQEVLTQLKQHLKRSRINMEKQANKKRRSFTFQEGDLVLLKLQPYRQTTVAQRLSQKLAKKYYGPFKVVKRVENVDYLLDLPSSSRIHPVVHVSLLKPFHGEDMNPDCKQSSQQDSSIIAPVYVSGLSGHQDEHDLHDTETSFEPVGQSHTVSSLDPKPPEQIKANITQTEDLPSVDGGCVDQEHDDGGCVDQERDDGVTLLKADRQKSVKLRRGEFAVRKRESMLENNSEVPKLCTPQMVLNPNVMDESTTQLKCLDKFALQPANVPISVPKVTKRVCFGNSCIPAKHTARDMTIPSNIQSKATFRIPPYLPEISPPPKITTDVDSPKPHSIFGSASNTSNPLPSPATTWPKTVKTPLNLEDKVPFGPGSNDMKLKRSNRIKMQSVWLKDFVLE
ncbi:uncharacterized protein LOC131640630 [Vicia villosa]|uniref:uncharacterized protein LOC131640630 n=1 Tax=Vicia villosa TaxID=3911 RepID=UPI00273C7D88|nr:uncharacterized protein LOC131640630 [Vicia villosa]